MRVRELDRNTDPKSRRRSDSGMTLIEVMAALMIVSMTALPLLISLADSHRRVAESSIKRRMKQLMEYKLSHVLLDRPAEGQEPIYVDGAENNFGEEFSAASTEDMTYNFEDETLYFYSYRIDSEEIDLGSSGGITGEEEEEAETKPTTSGDPGGNPLGGLGGGEGAQEESLGQLRYLVTLSVIYDRGVAKHKRTMSIVTYVKHPFESEAMTGPDLGPGGSDIGSGESNVGESGDPTNGGNALTGGESGGDSREFRSMGEGR